MTLCPTSSTGERLGPVGTQTLVDATQPGALSAQSIILTDTTEISAAHFPLSLWRFVVFLAHSLMFDFHTHRLDAAPGTAIVCLPQEAILHAERWLQASPDGRRLPHAAEGALYAAGVHPWWTLHADFDLAAHTAGLERLLALPEVVHVGECGLDRAILPTEPAASARLMARQEEVFEAMVRLSEKFRLPLTIHCVRAFDALLRLKKHLAPTQQWTIHGFRGRPALAAQLLDAGLDLSFGPRRNDEAYALTPPDRRHDESDSE